MSNYYLHLVVLNNCPYGNEALKLIKKHEISFKSINVEHHEKHKFVTDKITTFPQIYLKKNDSKKSLLLGGYDDLKHFMHNFHNKQYDANKVAEYQSKKSDWSEKAILRFIELINN